jgi:hypothetical protein
MLRRETDAEYAVNGTLARRAKSGSTRGRYKEKIRRLSEETQHAGHDASFHTRAH